MSVPAVPTEATKPSSFAPASASAATSSGPVRSSWASALSGFVNWRGRNTSGSAAAMRSVSAMAPGIPPAAGTSAHSPP